MQSVLDTLLDQGPGGSPGNPNVLGDIITVTGFTQNSFTAYSLLLYIFSARLHMIMKRTLTSFDKNLATLHFTVTSISFGAVHVWLSGI